MPDETAGESTDRISEPGIYSLPDKIYHGDPCPKPSLSSSVAKILLDRSPLHAWHSHPRLNPDYRPRPESKTLDLGSVAHRVILEQSWKGIAVCDANDWRTKDARVLRDVARERGAIPILRKQQCQIEAMATAAADIGLFQSVLGQSSIENTVAWQEGQVWCRVKPDILPSNSPCIWDFKTTGLAATPEHWGRTQLPEYLLQYGLYTRGVRKVLGWEECEMRFVVQETEPPFSLAIFALADDYREFADRLADKAIRLWTECVTTNHWPGYQTDYAIEMELPAWLLYKLTYQNADPPAAKLDPLELQISDIP